MQRDEFSNSALGFSSYHEPERKSNLPRGIEALSIRDFERSVPTMRRLTVLIDELHIPSPPVRVSILFEKCFEEHKTRQALDIGRLGGSLAALWVDPGAV